MAPKRTPRSAPGDAATARGGSLALTASRWVILALVPLVVLVEVGTIGGGGRAQRQPVRARAVVTVADWNGSGSRRSATGGGGGGGGGSGWTPRRPVLDASQPPRHRMAVVQVLGYAEKVHTRIHVDQRAAILHLRGRLSAIHGGIVPLDHVAVMCDYEKESRAARTLPTVRVVWFNCSELERAFTSPSGEKIVAWWKPFHKLSAMLLVEYHKVLVLDLDVTLLSDVTGMMRWQPTPAMAAWTEYPTMHMNSGVFLLRPSIDTYQDAISMIRMMEPNRTKRMGVLRHEVSLGWARPGPVSQREETIRNAVRSNPEVLKRAATRFATPNGDQEFLRVFYNMVFREQHGPLKFMPYRFNVRHATLVGTLDRTVKDISGRGYKDLKDWEWQMEVAFGGARGDDLGRTDRGPAAVHSTTTKVGRWDRCDDVHHVFFVAALWGWCEICRPCLTASIVQRSPVGSRAEALSYVEAAKASAGKPECQPVEGVGEWCQKTARDDLDNLAQKNCNVTWPR